MTFLLWLLLAQTKISVDQIRSPTSNIGTRVESGLPMLALCRSQQLMAQKITMTLFQHIFTDGVAWPLVDPIFSNSTLQIATCSGNWTTDLPKIISIATVTGANPKVTLVTWDQTTSTLLCVVVNRLNPDGKTFTQAVLQLGPDFSMTDNVMSFTIALQSSDLVLVEWVTR